MMMLSLTTMSARKPSGRVRFFVDDGDGDFGLDWDGSLFEFEGQTLAVHGFKQARTYGPVDLYGQANDTLGQVLVEQHPACSGG